MAKNIYKEWFDKYSLDELAKAPVKPASPVVFRQLLTLDPASAENGAVKNQEQWIAYWNNITDGRRFASLADYYQVFRQLTDALRNGSSVEKVSAEQSLASLRKDFQESYLLTSTRISYQPNSLEARLIHGYGASNHQLTSEKVLQVPEYWKTPIASVYALNENLIYLQALLNTDESGQTIVERLSVISDYQPYEIILWTPPLQGDSWHNPRNLFASRAVELHSDSAGFHLNASGHPVGVRGRSRGVR